MRCRVAGSLRGGQLLDQPSVGPVGVVADVELLRLVDDQSDDTHAGQIHEHVSWIVPACDWAAVEQFEIVAEHLENHLARGPRKVVDAHRGSERAVGLVKLVGEFAVGMYAEALGVRSAVERQRPVADRLVKADRPANIEHAELFVVARFQIAEVEVPVVATPCP